MQQAVQKFARGDSLSGGRLFPKKFFKIKHLRDFLGAFGELCGRAFNI
jgi:hypothetical protein